MCPAHRRSPAHDCNAAGAQQRLGSPELGPGNPGRRCRAPSQVGLGLVATIRASVHSAPVHCRLCTGSGRSLLQYLCVGPPDQTVSGTYLWSRSPFGSEQGSARGWRDRPTKYCSVVSWFIRPFLMYDICMWVVVCSCALRESAPTGSRILMQLRRDPSIPSGSSRSCLCSVMGLALGALYSRYMV